MCNDDFPNPQSTPSGSFFFACRLGGLVLQNQLSKHVLCIASSRELPEMTWYSAGLMPQAGSVSMVQSMKWSKSTAVVRFMCFSAFHNVHFRSSTISFFSHCTKYFNFLQGWTFSPVTLYIPSYFPLIVNSHLESPDPSINLCLHSLEVLTRIMQYWIMFGWRHDILVWAV